MLKTQLSNLDIGSPPSAGSRVSFVKTEESILVYDVMFRERLSFRMRGFCDSFPVLTRDEGSLGSEVEGKAPVWEACLGGVLSPGHRPSPASPAPFASALTCPPWKTPLT